MKIGLGIHDGYNATAAIVYEITMLRSKDSDLIAVGCLVRKALHMEILIG